MRKVSDTEANLKKNVAYKKRVLSKSWFNQIEIRVNLIQETTYHKLFILRQLNRNWISRPWKPVEYYLAKIARLEYSL